MCKALSFVPSTTGWGNPVTLSAKVIKYVFPPYSLRNLTFGTQASCCKSMELAYSPAKVPLTVTFNHSNLYQVTPDLQATLTEDEGKRQTFTDAPLQFRSKKKKLKKKRLFVLSHYKYTSIHNQTTHFDSRKHLKQQVPEAAGPPMWQPGQPGQVSQHCHLPP